MKNNKGFTLIELLATILVLGIILTITIYSVNSILKSSEESLSDTQINNIIEAAKKYYIKEGMKYEYQEAYQNSYNKTVCVSVSRLSNLGYIDKTDVIDPKTDEVISGYIKITNTNNIYSYSYVSSSSGCSVTDE